MPGLAWHWALLFVLVLSRLSGLFCPGLRWFGLGGSILTSSQALPPLPPSPGLLRSIRSRSSPPSWLPPVPELLYPELGELTGESSLLLSPPSSLLLPPSSSLLASSLLISHPHLPLPSPPSLPSLPSPFLSLLFLSLSACQHSKARLKACTPLLLVAPRALNGTH